MLLVQRVCRQSCTRDGDAPPLEQVVFCARRRRRWRWRWKRGQRWTRHLTSRG
jgi:hypothetical protein